MKNLGERFFNREWSWIAFNERVLQEAEDKKNPLLERLKFVAIFANNLDEFFMVRVAGLYRQIDANILKSGIDKRPPKDQVEGIHLRVHELIKRQEKILADILKELTQQGVRISGYEELNQSDRVHLDRYYNEVIFPVLTPTIIGPKHPFPRVQNLNLYLVVDLRETGKRKQLEDAGKKRIGFIALPKVLPRFIAINDAHEERFIPLESVIIHQLSALFAGYKIVGVNAIRVTRDADIALDEEATDDMRRALAKKLLGRRHGSAVRLEHGSKIDERTLEFVTKELELSQKQRYPQRHLMQATDLMQIYGGVERGDLKDEAMMDRNPRANHKGDIFDWIRKDDRLVYHPYHRFDPVSELVVEAADDPNVLAIKQTLYRTSGNSPVIRGLTRAAESGKSVTVVVELRARFDEERNIEWAQRLEDAGAHVVYGLVGYKTHCKALLVVRREKDGIKRYVHLGTGNYNDATARIYTDMGLFSDDEELGEDISALFNVITGATEPPDFNKISMSPAGIRRKLIAMIEREIQHAKAGQHAQIIAKMNALVHEEVIEALYKASQAGVKIDLIIRGICTLIPGVKGLSENINIISIVGRYLEHARIFSFANAGEQELYLSSADWMGRNLERRVELMFPITNRRHQSYINEVFSLQLRDNVKARKLLADGEYRRCTPDKASIVNSQEDIFKIKDPQRERKKEASQRFIPLGRGDHLE